MRVKFMFLTRGTHIAASNQEIRALMSMLLDSGYDSFQAQWLLMLASAQFQRMGYADVADKITEDFQHMASEAMGQTMAMPEPLIKIEPIGVDGREGVKS